ncbi:MAG: hypothetical protein KA171_21010 [Reyranella sp.]|nr:hypothetical protein [Reyranella sp.]
MSVFRNKQRGNQWAYDFVIGGERFRGYCLKPDGTPATKRSEAADAEGRVRAAAKAGQGMAKSGIRPGGYLLAQALTHHIARQVDSSASHGASVRRIVGELLRFFGPGRPIVEIDAPNVEAYRAFAVAQKRKVWIGGPRKIAEADHGNPRLWRELDRPRSASEVNHCLDVLRCALDIAHKTQDPMTGHSALPFPPVVSPVFEVKRVPTPMPEAELASRIEAAPPWTQEAALLARFFGCRLSEALTMGLRHIDHQARCLRLLGGGTKSGRDEPLHGGEIGWALVLQLEAQARRRGQTHLVTWPGLKATRRMRLGEAPADDAVDPVTGRSIWGPLKSIRKSWNTSAKAAGVDHPHRYHDVRAAYITDIDRVAGATATRLLARHASMSTTQKYIGLDDQELAGAANRAAKRRAKLKVVR